MPGPFTTTQLSFLTLIYGAIYALSVDQVVCAWVLGTVCLFLLALYTVLCTPTVVFLAQAELGESGQESFKG